MKKNKKERKGVKEYKVTEIERMKEITQQHFSFKLEISI